MVSHEDSRKKTRAFVSTYGDGHSRPQSPRSFWSAPRIETSGRDRSRKSANHGLPALVRSLRNLNNNGYYRLQKWAAIALARDLVPARGLDPWRRPKGSWALGTRMGDGRHSGKMSARALTRSRHFRGRAQAERLDSRETIREKMVAIQKFPLYVFFSRR